MILYSTNLVIEDFVIPYEVYKEGHRLFFKPLKIVEGVDSPIFWVTKVSDTWELLNIEDEKFIKQVQDDILKHQVN